MRPSVVIWDVEGTLVQRAVSRAELGLRALTAGGISPPAPRAESVERVRQLERDANLHWRTLQDEAEGFQTMAAVLLEGVEPPATPEQIVRVGAMLAAYDDTYRPVPAIPDLLTELQARGVKQAVVSNWPPSLRRFLDYHDLGRFSSIVMCSAEEGVVKPDPGLFRRALRLLEISPSDAICVGDRLETDTTPARAIGMHAIHFDPESQNSHADARDTTELRALLFTHLGLAAVIE